MNEAKDDLLERLARLESALPKSRSGTWRPTVAWISLVIAAIVFMSYHYTWAMFSDAIAILTDAAEPSDVKDGVIQLLGAVAQSSRRGRRDLGVGRAAEQARGEVTPGGNREEPNQPPCPPHR